MPAAWIALLAWLALYPLVGWQQGTLWTAHFVAVVLLGLCALPRLVGRERVRLGVPALATIAALVSLGLALAFAPSPLPRREMEWAALTGAGHALFFLLCLAVVPPADAPDASVRARHGLALLLTSIVIGQAAAVLGGLDGAGDRATGTLGNPNALGAVAAACGLALAGLWGLTRRSFLLVLLVLPLVLATGSRGALATLAGALLLLAMRRRRWKLLAALAAVGLLVLVTPNPVAERLRQLQPEHSFTRPFLWRAALTSIAEHPLGIGPAMNQYVFPAHAWDPDHPWLLHQRHSVGLTHNVLLTLALEWGWLAGAAALALTAWAVVAVLRQPPRFDPLAAGAALGATVLFLELQVDGLEQQPIAFSLFLLLAACALARLPRPRSGPSLPGRVVAALLVAALLALSGLTVWRTTGLLAARGADEALAAFRENRLDVQGARAAIARAEAALPGELPPLLRRCDLEEAHVRRLLDDAAPGPRVAEAADLARGALDAARAVNPADPSLPRRAADLETELRFRTGRPKDWERPIKALQSVLALDPLDVETRWELAHVAQRAGQHALRDEQTALVFGLEPDYALAWDGLARLLEADGDLEGALHAAVRAEEAWLNCKIKVHFPEAGSSAFYRNNLDTVSLPELRARIRTLRQTLYF